MNFSPTPAEQTEAVIRALGVALDADVLAAFVSRATQARTIIQQRAVIGALLETAITAMQSKVNRMRDLLERN